MKGRHARRGPALPRTSGCGKGPAAAAASLVLHRGHMPVCGVVDALHGRGEGGARQVSSWNACTAPPPQLHRSLRPCHHWPGAGAGTESLTPLDFGAGSGSTMCYPLPAVTHIVDRQAPLNIEQVPHPRKCVCRRQRPLHRAAQQQPLLELCRVAASLFCVLRRRSQEGSGAQPRTISQTQIQARQHVPSSHASHSQVGILVKACIPLSSCFLRRVIGSSQADRHVGYWPVSGKQAPSSTADVAARSWAAGQQGSSQSWLD